MRWSSPAAKEGFVLAAAAEEEVAAAATLPPLLLGAALSLRVRTGRGLYTPSPVDDLFELGGSEVFDGGGVLSNAEDEEYSGVRVGRPGGEGGGVKRGVGLDIDLDHCSGFANARSLNLKKHEVTSSIKKIEDLVPHVSGMCFLRHVTSLFFKLFFAVHLSCCSLIAEPPVW